MTTEMFVALVSHSSGGTTKEMSHTGYKKKRDPEHFSTTEVDPL
jgi:hypothetical protein